MFIFMFTAVGYLLGAGAIPCIAFLLIVAAFKERDKRLDAEYKAKYVDKKPF